MTAVAAQVNDLRPRLAATEADILAHKHQKASLEEHAHFAGTRLSGVESTLQFVATRLSATEAAAQALNTDVQKLWAGLAAEMRAREATDKRAIQALEAATEAAEAPIASASVKMPDALYMALQERFRGSQNQIRNRQRVYLPILTDRGIGTADMPVLDLGCGRGEWLQVLQSEVLNAHGVDSNPLMVEACVALGLRATKQDSLVYLSALPAASIGAVTSFHLIEHLSFRTLVQLVENAFRVLKPGGLLILETPNPANVLVGSHTFYLDPTHVKPIPSELLWFIFESRGFQNLRIIELHPPELPSGRAAKLPQSIARAFQAGLDYSIIGERP